MKKKKFTEEIYQQIKDNNSKENPFDINDYDRQSILNWLNNRKARYKISLFCTFLCEDCKKQTYKKLNLINAKYGIKRFKYCLTCNQKHTNLERRGVEYNWQAEDVKEKIKQTNLKRYGVEHALQNKDILQKVEKTCIKKYGTKRPSQNKKVQEKTKQTNLEHYGVEYSFQSEEVKEKIKQTNLERYGTEYANQNENIKEKIKKTNLERYGEDNPAKSDIVKQKVKKTNLANHGGKWHTQTKEFLEQVNKTSQEKYGTDYPMQDKSVLDKARQTFVERYGSDRQRLKYKYKDEYFDSKWEFCFYLYHLTKKHTIERESNGIEFYYNGSKKFYYPDFKINKKYYEIKGEQFIVRYKNGNIKTLINPYDSSKNNLYKEKYKCMKKHNVIIIDKTKINKYINFVEKNYGKEYIEKFRINKK